MATPEEFGYDSMSVDTVKDELLLQSTLLSSLHAAGQGNDPSARGFKSRIRALRTRLAELQGLPASQDGSSSSGSPAEDSDSGRPSNSKPRSTQPFRSTSGNSMATPVSGQRSMSGVKRSAEYLSSPTYSAPKSRRTSPSPRFGARTPVEPDAFIDLTGDDDFAELINEERSRYDREQQRGRQLKFDEEFARRLQDLNQGDQSSSSSSTVSRPPPSTQNLVQHTLPRAGQPPPSSQPRVQHTLPRAGQPPSSQRSTVPLTLLNNAAQSQSRPAVGHATGYQTYSNPAVQVPGVSSRTSPHGVVSRSNRVVPTYDLTGPEPPTQPGRALPWTNQPGASMTVGRPAVSSGTMPTVRYDHVERMPGAYPNPRAQSQSQSIPLHTSHPVTTSFQNRGPEISNSYSTNLPPPNPAGGSGTSSLATFYNALQSGSNYAGSMFSTVANALARPGGPNGLPSLIDLDERLQSHLYPGARDFFGYNDDYVDPAETAKELEQLLTNIRPDLEIAKEAWERTPEGMTSPLYPHQQLALTWMKRMEEESNKGGILADEMGLGKTISTLALMVSRPSTDPLRKTTLIVGPLALIRQWEGEIKNKIDASHRFSTFIYHNKKDKVNWDDLRVFDVVLTTYGTLGAEYSRWERQQKEISEQRNPAEFERRLPEAKKVFPLTGDKSLWYRIILDEAQCIKNRNTKTAQGAYRLKASHRFCLTGTPMMNGVHELYSLIHFLQIKPYNYLKRFTSDFGCLSKGGKGDTEVAMQKLQAVLKAILLRRTKKSEIDGKPILKLPEKVEVTSHAEFDNDQATYYKSIETNAIIQFNKYVKEGTVSRNYSNILVLLLRLRQAACHPHLIMDYEEDVKGGAAVGSETMVELAKSLSPDVIKRISEIENFECAVCYDGVPNPKIVIPCGHDLCSECLVKISENIARAGIAAGEENSDLRCPSCRGKIEMRKVIDYSVFKSVHIEKAKSSDSEEKSEDLADSETESESDESDVDKKGNLKGFVVSDKYESDTDSDDVDGEKDDKKEPREAKKNKNTKKSKRRSKKGKGKGKAKDEPVKHTSLPMLKKLAAKGGEGRKRYYKYLRDNFVTSAKLDKTMEAIQAAQETNEKTIVFSQFTTLLDLLEIPVQDAELGYERYDGSMNADARQAAVENFTTKPDCKVMLVSLRAGNAGLNLTAASRIVIMDPAWNPFIEMQAVDRAHRIGQTRTVNVSRILVEDTVEDRIMALQEKKRKMVDQALDEGVSQRMGRLTEADFRYLFNGGRVPLQL